MATLTEKQLKRTINNKLASAKPLLISPEALFWPLLDEIANEKFVTLFGRFLQEIGFVKPKVPDATSATSRANIAIPDYVRCRLKIGVNSTIRALRSKTAECLLISSDIAPKLLAKQIINMALHQCPTVIIVVVPNLSDLMKNTLGIACCLCAIDILPTKLKIHLLEATNSYEKPKNFQLKAITVAKELQPIEQQPLQDVDFTKVYLRKPSNGTRAFEPPMKMKSETIKSTPPGFSDYITFNDESSDETMDVDDGSDKEKIESTVIQLKDLNLPSLKETLPLESKKMKKRKKPFRSDNRVGIKYTPVAARKIYGNPQKKKKNKNKSES